MPTHTCTHTHTKHLSFKPGFYSKATVSFGQAAVARLPNTYVCASPHYRTQTFDQTVSSPNADTELKHHAHCGLHYQVWFHVSACVTVSDLQR